MIVDPFAILTKRIGYRSLGFLALLAAYTVFLLFVFFYGVKPSLAADTTNQDFAVDSTVYMELADSLKNGTIDPIEAQELLSFPNTVIAPVSIYLVLNNPFSVLMFNCAIFCISLILLSQTFSIPMHRFMFLLLLNPTTTTSLLCLNKEIIDIFIISLFLYSTKHNRRALTIASLIISFLNRYEICVVFLVCIFVQTRFNPLRKHRFLVLFVLVSLLTITMPFFASSMLSHRFQEAKYGGAVAVLDNLQIHYLYIVAVIPKIAENLFGQLVNPAVWNTSGAPQADNAPWLYNMLFNNLASLILVFILLGKRMLRLRYDLVYCSAIGAVLVAQSLAIQPRYFYFIYVLLCLQAAHPATKRAGCVPVLNLGSAEVANA